MNASVENFSQEQLNQIRLGTERTKSTILGLCISVHNGDLLWGRALNSYYQSIMNMLDQTELDTHQNKELYRECEGFLFCVFWTGLREGNKSLAEYALNQTEHQFPLAINPFDNIQNILYMCGINGQVGMFEWMTSKEMVDRFGATLDLEFHDNLAISQSTRRSHHEVTLWLLQKGVPPTARRHFVFNQMAVDGANSQYTRHVAPTLLGQYTLDDARDVVSNLVTKCTQQDLRHTMEELLLEYLSPTVREVIIKEYIIDEHTGSAMRAASEKMILSNLLPVKKSSPRPWKL